MNLFGQAKYICNKLSVKNEINLQIHNVQWAKYENDGEGHPHEQQFCTM